MTFRRQRKQLGGVRSNLLELSNNNNVIIKSYVQRNQNIKRLRSILNLLAQVCAAQLK